VTTHREALERLRALVVGAEGCPVPTEMCDCVTGDDCVISDVLATGDQACSDQETLARQVRGALGMFLGGA